MDQYALYRDIAGRCDGDIYIGVVGPVRTGKSSFIRRFMELMVLPGIESGGNLDRMRDELPQSGDGRMVMTNQIRFVPNEAVALTLPDSGSARVRLVDCVGYMVDGALGADENGEARMVSAPWSDRPIPFDEAAETGTRRVIEDHSTIGVVVTTDGSILDLPRDAYARAEARTIAELKQLGKPFAVLLNSTHPQAGSTIDLRDELQRRYDVPVMAADVAHMRAEDMQSLLSDILLEFPLRELRIEAPGWVAGLDADHWLGGSVLESIRTAAKYIHHMRDGAAAVQAMRDNEYVESAQQDQLNMNDGSADLRVHMKEGLFYRILGEACGCEIDGEEHLFDLMKRMAADERAYARIAPALKSAESAGYGVVLPEVEEMELNPPELARDGGHYGVRLHASAPSIHMVRVSLQTDVSPIVGTEKQSGDLLESLIAAYRKDPAELWNTEVFGKPLRDLVRDEMGAKLLHLSDDVREKLGQSLGKIINEGSGGMLCILL